MTAGRNSRRLGLAVLIAVLTLALGVASALAGKSAEATFGGTGTLGEQFRGPRDIAVDQSTGQIYVVDAENKRIQRFGPSYDFELAFGRDVIAEGKPGDFGDAFEVCTVATDCKAGVNGDGAPIGEQGPGGSALAIDQTTGDVYALDGNFRILKFSFDDNGTPADSSDDIPVFDRVFGWDVVQPGGVGEVKGSERQRVILGVPLPVQSGTFTLTANPTGAGAQTTAPIPYNASQEQLQSALDALSNIAPGDVTVSGPPGGPWTLDFAGAYAGLDIGQLGLNGAGLQGTQENSFAFSARVESPVNGAGFEICTVASQCQRGAGDSNYRDAGVISGQAIAIAPPGSPNAGDVFLADTSNARVEQFEADGGFVRAWGWGIDTGADQFEVCTAASVCQTAVPPPGPFGAQAVPQNGQFAAVTAGGLFSDGTGPQQITIDSSGVVYASNVSSDGARIDRFDSTKSLATDLLLPNPIGGANPPPGFPAGPLPAGTLVSIEIDPDNDHLYYLAGSGVGISEIDATPPTDVPALVDTHMQGVGLDVSVVGLGYSNTPDRLFVSALCDGGCDEGADQINRIVAVGNTGAPLPVIALDDPSDVGPHQATFTAEVTPNGPLSIDTSYRFEYRKPGDPSWTSIPAMPVNLGDGSSPIAVEQTAINLEAGNDYEVRLIASKTFGAGTATEGPIAFQTQSIAPAVDTLAPQRLTDTEATLTAELNPNGIPTEYRFEYLSEEGFQANGYADAQRVPLPDGVAGGAVAIKISEDVDGLDPETTYRYRLVATNANGSTDGDDVLFTTHPTPTVVPNRGFEMVTPPFKSVRAGVWPGALDGYNPNVALPSLGGDTVLWATPFFPLTDDVGAPANGDQRIFRRSPQGWSNQTLNTLGLWDSGPFFLQQNSIASSGDLETQAIMMWGGPGGRSTGALLPTEGSTANRLYTRRPGTGTKGYTPWLTNPDTQYEGLPENFARYANPKDSAIFNDDGTTMVRWGRYRGLGEDPGTPGDDDPSDDAPIQGSMVYLQHAEDADELPVATKVPVNACTAGAAIPSRTAAGNIGTRDCTTNTPDLTSPLGAVVGGRVPDGREADQASQGPASTALSDDGKRIFFESPDPTEETAPISCQAGSGSATSCPPQLYVRQYDSEGNATVRWISRAQGVGTQKVTEMGAGVGFQGASRDGRYVYFKTNAPLLPTDPNGGNSITAGSASEGSWDLYRYELPAGLDEDPANGILTRVSGGPSGTADPGTNQSIGAAGSGAPLRFLSDGGQRAYFVTTAPIAGADATPPVGGSTSPGGAVGNETTRNLYLFDDTESGSAKYKFVAQIPFLPPAPAGQPGALDVCATYSGSLDYQLHSSSRDNIDPSGGSCFRGTPDGRHILFFTTAQLTADDRDSAGDIYLYDADADQLSRVSAPLAASKPYVCNRHSGPPAGECHADLGWQPYSFGDPVGGQAEKARGWGGMRYANIAEEPDGNVSVFFESRSELVPADGNGDHWDVYQWREGKLSLVSRALPNHHSYYSGNSVDGRDVFVWTSDRIDPREIDDFDFDIYDARVGGGFPSPPVTAPCDVLAHQCRGEAMTSSPEPGRSSEDFVGSGNLAGERSRPRCARGKLWRRGRCVRARKARKHASRHRHRGKHHNGGDSK